MQRERTHPGTVYEVFGYDIVLNDELKPFLCEINETPNMGLEVNYHPDYSGKGEEMEKGDYEYKTRLMDASCRRNVDTLQCLGTPYDPKNVLKIIQDGNFACLAEIHNSNDGDECLTAADISTRRPGSRAETGEVSEYDQVFPY